MEMRLKSPPPPVEPHPAARSEASTTARAVLRLYMPREECKRNARTSVRVRMARGRCLFLLRMIRRPVFVLLWCFALSASATSRYVTDHAAGPLKWQEWGKAAIDRAQKEKR